MTSFRADELLGFPALRAIVVLYRLTRRTLFAPPPCPPSTVRSSDQQICPQAGLLFLKAFFLALVKGMFFLKGWEPPPNLFRDDSQEERNPEIRSFFLVFKLLRKTHKVLLSVFQTFLGTPGLFFRCQGVQRGPFPPAPRKMP